MKKLKKNVFLVIFLILTLITTGILCVYNIQLYNQQKQGIEHSLNETMFDRMIDKMDNMFERPDGAEPKKDFGNIKFMDRTVYNVILNSDNSVSYVINHSSNDITEEEISKIAEQIVNEGCNYKIGSLYFTRYSYKFEEQSYITVVDNSSTNTLLLNTLIISVALFIALEALITFIAYKISKQITAPVAESFEKQKQFIADASHELKTPLAVIIASADALESNPQEKKWLDNIKSESDRMSRLIADLLELAKTEEVENKSEYAVSNLSKLVQKSTLTFESVMFEKGVLLNDDIQDNIELYMDSFKIQQLLSILLDNAVKHSESGSEINVTLAKDKDITLCVTNKGEGIPKGEEEKIFERFYRADASRNRNENRYGLGLAIAKNIVTSHGGTITAKSENGYTTFKIVFKA